MTIHPIPPVYDSRSRVLILGSFPSVKSREEGFFYGHPQNRFWRVLSAVLGCSVPLSVEDKKRMLLQHRVALWDVIASCEITGSADSSIKNAVPNDLNVILGGAPIEAIRDLLPMVDMVLIMTVEPGFGGQKFQPGMMAKMTELRKLGYVGLIEADGGLNVGNLPTLREHGLDVAVMGTAMFRSETPKEDMEKIHAM